MSTLLTQISWSNHLAILSSSKSDEKRKFYIRLSIKERYSARALQRQLDSGYFERYMLSTEKLEPQTRKFSENEFLSRSLSPTLVSEYTLKLIDKKLLRQKLHELTKMTDLNLIDSEGYND
ncbi:putative cytoplasmic protein [Fusibacter sp. 3D3]|nr:putative cytoplasmic protein [Fusibacter sp. 3D3]